MLTHPDQSFREAVASHDVRLRHATARPGGAAHRAIRRLRSVALPLAGSPLPRL
jgi:hypothetical protein